MLTPPGGEGRAPLHRGVCCGMGPVGCLWGCWWGLAMEGFVRGGDTQLLWAPAGSQ